MDISFGEDRMMAFAIPVRESTELNLVPKRNIEEKLSTDIRFFYSDGVDPVVAGR
jgi:hypothetical protein